MQSEKGRNMIQKRQKYKQKINSFKLLSYLLLCLTLMFLMLENITVSAMENDNLTVSFINVGQGDGALLESNGKYMLIDGGPIMAGPTVTNLLKSKNIKKIDYILATHQHEDHIGGLIDVIKNFEVGNLIMTNTSFPDPSYNNFIDAVENKNLKRITPVMGQSFKLGSATVTFMAPNGSDYATYNDNSIVVKVVNGENSFLFTGDAESVSEKEMLDKGYDLKSDVLKVAHHSALTSSTQEFLNAVDPSISVISCDESAPARFPRITTLKKLENTDIYRTDVSGTITMVSDGKEITADKTPYSYAGDTIDILTGNSIRGNTAETKNLSNPSATIPGNSLTIENEYDDEDYELLLGGTLPIVFNADYGVSSLEKIEYALAPADLFNNVGNVEWAQLSKNELILNEDFMGCIYVKYVNKLGNTMIRKTQGFTLDATAPENCIVVSNVSGINLLDTYAMDTYSKKASGPVTLQFNADFGISDHGKTEYMLVPRGKEFDPEQSWTNGNAVTIKKDYIGCVYVRFTDGAGNVTTKKTTGFSYVSKQPINTMITSKAKDIKFVNWGSKSGNSTVKSPVILNFSADFGASGKESIQYMLEDNGQKGKWINGNSVTIQKGFNGRVYVRFTDKKGNYVTRNSNLFTVK
ncbi:MAG: hypothetical protein K0R05_1974 [Anaerocolumna sp.]|nr:hypothetical protein [Anaerocolumna sp.]